MVAKAPPRDPWMKINAFDRAIRRSFPEIRKTLAVRPSRGHDGIKEFLANFQQDCDPTEFWYMWANEGDGHFESLEQLGEKSWLFNGTTEMTVTGLLVHRDDAHPYKNFFILLFGPDKEFAYSTAEGSPIECRPTAGMDSRPCNFVG